VVTSYTDFVASGLTWVLALAAVAVLLFAAATAFICAAYMRYIVRIFEEEPLLLPPQNGPLPGVEEVRFPTSDGLWLYGTWLPSGGGMPRGVIIFCHGFKMNRAAATAYCRPLQEAGFAVFTFDFRGHGDSPNREGYRPMQWATHYEVRDLEAAIRHVVARQEERGLRTPIGLFGVSRGGTVALLVASRAAEVKALVTDGAFPTHSMQQTFMLRWVGIYSDLPWIYRRIPHWYYGFLCFLARCVTGWRNRCWFPSVERAAARLIHCPWLLIHGERDSYVPVSVAQMLFERAKSPKEIWIVAGAKHNQCHVIDPDNYARRTCQFFVRHLASPDPYN
jgi:pimeloyl-ACP methyl ester carboxylesterase